MKNRAALLAALAGLALAAAGIMQGQNAAVMTKAIRVCLECVGIG